MSELANAELRRFSIFEQMSDERLSKIIERFPVQTAPAGSTLVTLDSMELNDVYLVAGIVRVTDSNGIETFIDDRSPLALEPLARKMPREFDIRAASDVYYLSLPPNLHHFNNINEYPVDDSEEYLAEPVLTIDTPANEHISEVADDSAILAAIQADLNNEELALPSPPEISANILQYMDCQSMTESELVSILLLEPTVAIKLIHFAQRESNGNDEKFTTIESAITQLGLKRSLDVVKHHNLHDQFAIDHQLVKERMRDYLRTSIHVAAISFLLARNTSNLNPDVALFAGLIHNIGFIPLINYIEHSPMFCHLSDLDDHAQQQLIKKIGTKILKHWHFDEALVKVTQDFGVWDRDPYGVADYADVVNMARLHTMLGQAEYKHQLPPIDKLPATQKLYAGKLTAKESIRLVDQGASIINEIKHKIRSTIQQRQNQDAT